MNPEHRYRLEQARDREVAGVDHLESDILAELHHDALCISVVAAEKHHWSITPVMRILHVVRTRGVETFQHATFAHDATCSAADVVWPMARPLKSGLTGFVQSMTILPARWPALSIAARVAGHGVAIAINSPKAAASATEPALAS